MAILVVIANIGILFCLAGFLMMAYTMWLDRDYIGLGAIFVMFGILLMMIAIPIDVSTAGEQVKEEIRSEVLK